MLQSIHIGKWIPGNNWGSCPCKRSLTSYQGGVVVCGFYIVWTGYWQIRTFFNLFKQSVTLVDFKCQVTSQGIPITSDKAVQEVWYNWEYHVCNFRPVNKSNDLRFSFQIVFQNRGGGTDFIFYILFLRICAIQHWNYGRSGAWFTWIW